MYVVGTIIEIMNTSKNYSLFAPVQQVMVTKPGQISFW